MTGATLYPGADSNTQWFGGAYPGSRTDPNVVVLHTTETAGWPGYGGGATAPHFTLRPDPVRKRVEVRQHFRPDRSSRALRNLSGGVETNTLNAVQVELIGTCDPRAPKDGRMFWPSAPDWALRELALLLRWLNAEWPDFPLKDAAVRGWLAYPSSYGASRARLSFAEWRNAYGVVGHQHVPENSHGDPGSFPIGRLLELARPVPTPKPKVLTMYTVTKRKPYGREYHGPGHARNAAGLRLYHLTNRPAGVRAAKRRGCKRVDLDVMNTRDRVPVVNHSLDAMGKEGFRAKGVEHRTIDRLTWPQVKKLRTGPHRIHHVRWVLEECARLDVIAALDLKGRWNAETINQLVQIANETGAWVYVKCDPRKTHLRVALKEFRKRGMWARYNGTGVFLRPL